MMVRPLWFRSIIWGEVLLQGPLCWVAAWAWLRGKPWIILPSLIYATHVLTTMIPIVAEILFAPHEQAMSARITLLAIYSPWIICPILLLLRSAALLRPVGAKRD